MEEIVTLDFVDMFIAQRRLLLKLDLFTLCSSSSSKDC